MFNNKDYLLDETQSQATFIIDDIDSKTSNNPNNIIKNTEPLIDASNNNNNNQDKQLLEKGTQCLNQIMMDMII